MPPVDRRFEPFVHLVDVTETSVLVAWGGFFLERGEEGWLVVDDDDLESPRRRGGGTIGASSPPYGAGAVEVLDHRGEVVASAATTDANHAWVEGLEPDTEYRYRVVVDGRPWAGTELWDWQLGGTDSVRADLRPALPHPPGRGRSGTRHLPGLRGLRRRHHRRRGRPPPAGRGPDPGEAVGGPSGPLPDGLGDNIYHGEEDALAQSGDEDDDWYFTFYEPYRYLLDHLPMYPAAGNHDGADAEASDDRRQLADNFHLDARFGPRVAAGRASLDRGLFYALRLGALLEIVCVDTSWGEAEGVHDFETEPAQDWLARVLPPSGGAGPFPVWRVPFSHHPAYCAGPHHGNMPELIERVLPLYHRAGVRLVLSGHEHNFQHGLVDGIHHVVSGAAGKLEDEPPCRWDDGGTVAWASEPHCLLVEVGPDRIVITPYGPSAKDGESSPIQLLDRDGRPAGRHVVIERET